MEDKKLELVSFSLCPYVQRARAILIEKNIKHEIKLIDLDSPPDWFFDVSLMEKVPVLLVNDKPLFESMVICEYLDEITEGSLHPTDPFEKAVNRAWIEFGNTILDSTYELLQTNDEKRFKQLTAFLDDKFDILEDECLKGTPFFNGDSFSIIDAVYAPIFRYHAAFIKYYDFGFFDDRPNLSLWRDTLLSYKAMMECVESNYNEELDAYLRKQDSIFSKKMKAES